MSMQKNQQHNNEVAAPLKQQKERRIVTWTQEEDDILREQISIHGTENWTIIASKFKDKTTRQCRRRWYTYLNSDFKKGGWSPEEDMLLCEAQKIFGNRWTEIAKVVSGRTDNAVKNRFSTLCKKRARREALAKENNTTFINPNNKRILIESGIQSHGTLDIAAPLKKLRTHISNLMENYKYGDMSHKDYGVSKQQLRPPFAVLAQNACNVDNLQPRHQVTGTKEGPIDAGNNKSEGTFLKRDDPKIAALMQQAELLSSLALKVNADNTEQSRENAWKVLRNFFNKSKENEELKDRFSDEDLRLDDIKELVEDLRSCSSGTHPSQRNQDLCDSSSSSEYSTGSTIFSNTANEQADQNQAEICTPYEGSGTELQSVHIGDGNGPTVSENKLLPGVTLDQENNGAFSAMSTSEFTSPLQVTPLFRSLASTIPSPQFSESERNFLMKTLGIESPMPTSHIDTSNPPPCRKALLQNL